ncbi:hypothetical protein EON79_07605 [bacterium]|nr:MAG: hypothetical protein EON79_07605 [bacterium]
MGLQHNFSAAVDPTRGNEAAFLAVNFATNTLTPVGSFASYAFGDDGVQAVLVDPSRGNLSSTALGAGTFPVDVETGVPNVSHLPVTALDRATAIGNRTPFGPRVHSLSFLDGLDSRRLKEDTGYTFNVLDNDPGFGTKTAALNTGPSHGTLSLAPNGVAVYTPTANWYGTDSFTYDLYVNGIYASTHTVTYTVLNVNDAPVAVDDNVGTVAGTALVTLSVLANDTNVDGVASPLRFLSTTQPSNGMVYLTNSKTVLKIKAAPGQAGQPFTFTYTVQNGTGFSSTARVSGTFAN